MLVLQTALPYLVVVVGCVAAATTTIAAANSSTGCGQSAGTLHRATGLLKRQGARRLRCWVMDVVEEVVSVAVAVAVTVAVLLRATGLLRG